jgi:hypothetical protein
MPHNDDIYDDPDLQGDDDEYPETVKFDRPGDSVRGTVLTVDRFDGRYGPGLKYSLRSEGNGRTVEVLAGASPKDLKSQLLKRRPRPGDLLSIELIELRPTKMGNPFKVFVIDVVPGDEPGRDDERPAEGASRSDAPSGDDDDLFGE